MTQGVLFDTHSLLWYASKHIIKPAAALAIGQAGAAGELFASVISIWEMGVAITKKQIHLVPDLGARTPPVWFTHTTSQVGAKALPISAEIAAEASLVPAIYGYGDPGDCFLIATARIHNLAFITRDSRMIALSAANPGYLSVIPC
jgi:PIN domain nuclease of toxin-antitoxin system